MLTQFIFSVNAVIPLFLLIALGFFLKEKNFLTPSFFEAANKFVLNILLPTILFQNVAATDLRQTADFKLAAFAVFATIFIFALLWFFGTFFIKDKPVLGSFVQGAFRANNAFMGIPLMQSIAGEQGVATLAFILVFIMPLYNILSIILFTSLATASGHANTPNVTKRRLLACKKIAASIFKNPLIISILIGTIFALLNIKLPPIAARPISDLAYMATPMALICLGGGIGRITAGKSFLYSLVASFVKLIVTPIIFTTAAYLLGFRGIELAAIMVLGALPSAIVGYVMAIQMGGDGETAGRIAVLSTLLSVFSLTFFVYLIVSVVYSCLS
ncbi:MAG: AEC family transporter [Defluviitaleaceae bacterium]|nr:AEC family transporter [Defluviitaleaceae bacterium]